METKICSKCGEDKDLSEFYIRNSGKQKGQPMAYCKKCNTICNRDWMYKTGKSHPMNKNRGCSSFLGIHVAEEVLAGLFEHVEKAPMNNPGWDFICGKKKRIDCKSSCLRQDSRTILWGFEINKNDKCDYFLCIAFDDRENLNPLHVWLIPGDVINHLVCLSITDSSKSLYKWKKYEKSLDKVLTCCAILKGD